MKLIDLLKVHYGSGKGPSTFKLPQDLEETISMLRMIAITSDVLRCVFDQSKVDVAHNNAEEQLAFIKNKVDHYIDGYLND